jgi:hypothetical protein
VLEDPNTDAQHKAPFHDTFVWTETGALAPQVGTPLPPPGWTKGWAETAYDRFWQDRSTWLPTADSSGPLGAASFRASMDAMLKDLQRTPPTVLKYSGQIDLTEVLEGTAAQLDPIVTVEAAAVKRLGIDTAVVTVTSPANYDPLDPVMVSPEFEFPMYEALSDLSTAWLFAGADETPPNSISLLHGNKRFIEAFMVGLSYEMGRMLLFNEYPTDQRGTNFRHFWDSPDPDIKAIHTWATSSKLGGNSVAAASPDNLLLMIRGDLLHRYPDTVIYAVKANPDGSYNEAPLATDVKIPSFHAALKPDATFLGFELSADTVIGDKSTTSPGYYFVIQQQHTAPHFGLEPYTSSKGGATAVNRDNVEWGNFVASGAALTTLNYIDASKPLPSISSPPADVRLTSNLRSSDLAWLTMRQPRRVVIHASKLLPAKTP